MQKGYRMANSEDQDEMPLHAAFHQGIHCLSSEKEYAIILTCNPTIHIMEQRNVQMSQM